MRLVFRLFICGLFVLFLTNNAFAKVNVFACEPEWKSLVDEIGGENVDSFSAISALQDPHYIRAKPSLIAKVRKADLLICSGADLEVGWLPILLEKANRDVQPGKIGYLMASEYVETIEKPEVIDRAFGDIHVAGNPHIHLDPYNILLVAKEINRRLKLIDEENSLSYENGYRGFVRRWEKAIRGWEREAADFNGMRVVVYHKSFSYLLKWLGISEAAILEEKPGISPSANYLGEMLKDLRGNPAKVAIRTPFDPDDSSIWLMKKTDIEAIILPFTVGGNEESGDLFGLFENSIDLLKAYDD
jgi:zinc/manganese transport system substrate-binding protein